MITHFKSKPIAILIIAAMILSIFPYVQTAKAADEYDGLRAKWETFLLGSSYNPADPDIAAEINLIDVTASDYWTNLNTVTGRTYLWSDASDWAYSSTISINYSRLSSMATAYRTSGSSLQGNSALASDIISALDWLYTNQYNATKTEIDNWFDWEIGIPQKLSDIMVLLYDQLNATQISNYISAIDKWCPNATNRVKTIAEEMGANRADKAQVLIIRGIVGKSSAKIAAGRDALSQIFIDVTSGNGYYADGSYVDHSYVAYTGSYGVVLLYDMAKLFYILNGSTWTITDPNANNVYDWVTKAYQPLLYKGAMMDTASGRKLARQTEQDHYSGRGVVRAIVLLVPGAPADKAAQFKSLIKAWVQQDTTYANYYTDLPDGSVSTALPFSIYQTVLLKSIMNDSAVVPSGELIKTQVFAGMDRVVHLRPGFGIALSMFSNRISAFEFGNGENLKAWWTGVGMTQLYNTDLSQYSQNYWATVDSFRLPGTTTDGTNGGTPIAWKSYANPNTWVGGSSINELYSSAGMQFSLSQNTGSPLQGKKSWFMLGDKMVALGAGITNTNNANVETIVENRKLNSNGDNTLTVNGVTKSGTLGWSESMTNVQWAHLAGSTAGSDIGYYFPTAITVNGLRESRTGAWSDISTTQSTTSYTNNYLSLALGHGVNPTNASYAYATLPNKSAAEVASYASSPDFTILENSTNVQAVKDNSLNVVGANFWNDASTTVSVGGTSFITSDKKASVTTLETANQIDIGVSDPTQSNTGTINIEINRSASGPISLDPGITVTQFSPTIKMTVNVKGEIGKTFNAKFNLGPAILPATADSYVRDGSYATNNFGTAAAWTVKNDATGYSRQAYLKFDLSAVKAAAGDAKIQLVPTFAGAAGITNQASLVSDNTWSESSLTWNNKPAASTLISSWTVPAVGTSLQFDVTSQVNAALSSDKLLSVLVSSPTNQGSTGDISYASKENSTVANRPIMLLYPATPTLSSSTVNNSQVTLNWPFVNGATGFKIKYGTSSGSYTNTINIANVSNINSYTVSGLTNGTAYYFVVSATNAAGETIHSNELSATPNPQPNPHVSLPATDDAYTRDGTYASTNYGTATTVTVKMDGTGYNRYSYEKYDLSSITGVVTSAKIQLVPTTVGMTGITNEAYLVSNNTWSETAITWNNQPAVSTLLSSWTVPTVGTAIQIDVTTQVIAALAADKKLSIRISQPTNQGSNGTVNYAAKEHGTVSYRPVIIIN